MSLHLLNLEVLFVLFLLGEGFLGDRETNCKCGERKMKEERWIEGLREGEKEGEVVCAGDGRER